MMPSSDVLICISKALGMSLDYFFRPFSVNLDPSAFEFRKSPRMGAKQVESLKYLVCGEIEKYIEIESILGLGVNFALDYSDVCVKGEDDSVLLAKRFRKDLNLGSDAIVSAVDLLELIGVKVIEVQSEFSFSGTCNMAGDIPVIVINAKMSPERKRLTLFHELGHLLLHCAPEVDKEKMCTVFANEVLIPGEKFTQIIGESRNDISLIELHSVQREYGISVDALVVKAFQLNVINPAHYRMYHRKKNASAEFKRAAEQSLYPKESADRFNRLVYRALASEVISASKAAALLNTSVSAVTEQLNLM